MNKDLKSKNSFYFILQAMGNHWLIFLKKGSGMNEVAL